MEDTRKIKIAALGALTAIVAVIATTSAAAGATGSCPAKTFKQAFSKYGDKGQYFLVPNGGFESGTTGWTLGGSASVVAGNETAYLNSASDTKSVKLTPNGWVRTVAFCVTPQDLTVRLMVKGASGQLKFDAKVVSGGNIRTWSTQVSAGSSGWRPSQVIQFAMSNQYVGASTLELTFTAIGSTWQIDDIFVDPFKG